MTSSNKARTEIPGWQQYGPLYSAAQTRALDRLAIEEGIPGFELMSLAGRAAFRVLRRAWPAAQRVLVVCGGGNNGGDGYIVAGHALASGLEVTCFAVVAPEQLKGDARRAYQWASARGVTSKPWPNEESDYPQPSTFDVVVDALLGTGLTGAVRAPFDRVIDWLNGHPHTLAIDIPSGLCADTGRILGHCLHASKTVTFIGRKIGLYTGQGPSVTGEIHFDALQVPQAVYARQPASAHVVSPDEIRRGLPARPQSAHKGVFGRVLLVGGDLGMPGAMLLAASACMRTGAGLVTAATRAQHAPVLVLGRPEVMFRPVDNPAQLGVLLDNAQVIVAGPGLGRDDWGRDLLRTLVDQLNVAPTTWRLVCDADALNLMAEDPSLQPPASVDWIMTPHPGEAARLLGVSVSNVENDRLAAAQQLVSRFGAHVVLKGAGTVIALRPTVGCASEIWVNPTGNPGMASAGMGDVLSGILGSLMAQGLTTDTAAVQGVAMHGWAGDVAAETTGQAGLLATDLVETLPRLFATLEGQGRNTHDR